MLLLVLTSDVLCRASELIFSRLRSSVWSHTDFLLGDVLQLNTGNMNKWCRRENFSPWKLLLLQFHGGFSEIDQYVAAAELMRQTSPMKTENRHNSFPVGCSFKLKEKCCRWNLFPVRARGARSLALFLLHCFLRREHGRFFLFLLTLFNIKTSRDEVKLLLLSVIESKLKPEPERRVSYNLKKFPDWNLTSLLTDSERIKLQLNWVRIT